MFQYFKHFICQTKIVPTFNIHKIKIWKTQNYISILKITKIFLKCLHQ